MNDRYLYRAKRTDNGEWVEGYLIHAKKDYYICENPYECMDEYSSLNGQSYGFGGFKFADQTTICQFTGLKDKNGKLIWENDIVNCFEAECCGKISWNESEAGFYFDVLLEDGSYEEEHIYDYVDCMEVIGNIFDNPELLEVGE